MLEIASTTEASGLQCLDDTNGGIVDASEAQRLFTLIWNDPGGGLVRLRPHACRRGGG